MQFSRIEWKTSASPLLEATIPVINLIYRNLEFALAVRETYLFFFLVQMKIVTVLLWTEILEKLSSWKTGIRPREFNC
jgi:hypothetical protein